MSGKYYWFQGETVVALVDQLRSAGPADCRLEVRHGPEDSLTLHVVPPEGLGLENAAHFVPLDKSHVCPPDCP